MTTKFDFGETIQVRCTSDGCNFGNGGKDDVVHMTAPSKRDFEKDASKSPKNLKEVPCPVCDNKTLVKV